MVGKNFEVDWLGDENVYSVVEATRRAINDLTETATDLMHQHPMWENETGQTEAAIFSDPAVIEPSEKHVYGRFGVRNRPREEDVIFQPSPAYERSLAKTGRAVPEPGLLTTVDVALLLEFGTVNQEGRPWIYPAYDTVTPMFEPLVKSHLEQISRSPIPTAIRDPLGRFMRH